MTSQAKDGYACRVLFNRKTTLSRNGWEQMCSCEECSNSVHKFSAELSVISYSKGLSGGWCYDKRIPFIHKNYVLIGSVELLNYHELENELGNHYESAGEYARDYWLAVQAYIRWGTSFTEHLYGDFSFSIINLHSGEFLGVRDHIGIRQYYYRLMKNGMAFSDCLSGVKTISSNCASFDQEFIADYLLQTFANEHATVFSDIRTLPPAHILISKNNNTTVSRYWQLNHRSIYQNDKDFPNALFEVLHHSVNKRLTGKNNLAILLSGGLDSSTILALMREIMGEELLFKSKVFAITKVFKRAHIDARRDERRYAEEIASICGIPLHYCDEEIQAPLDFLSDYYHRMGNIPYNPFFAIVQPIYKATSLIGADHLLTGFGGDEISSMSGKNVFPLFYERMKLYELFKIVNNYSKIYEKTFWQSARSLVIAPLLPQCMLNVYHGIKNPGQRKEGNISFLHPDVRHESERRRKVAQGILRAGSFEISEQIQRNIYNGILQHLIEVFSYSSAKYGIRFIHPLLDKEIMEFIAQVPPLEFVKDGWCRSLFRRAMVGVLPESIRCRKDKSVFSLPYEGYIQKSRNLIMDLLSSKNSTACNYLDFNRLQFWLKIVCDNQSSLKNAGMMSLKIAMAVNVGLFIENSNNARQKDSTIAVRGV